jgi:hypothetical protein
MKGVKPTKVSNLGKGGAITDISTDDKEIKIKNGNSPTHTSVNHVPQLSSLELTRLQPHFHNVKTT